MTVWAIADPHLSFGVPSKSMAAFGPLWESYTDKIADAWQAQIKKEDLVLIAGDISWAMRLEDAIVDLNWIDALPGTKVMIKGNHDFWWGSLSKIHKIMPPSIHCIQNTAFTWNGIAIGGARLWDSEEYRFDEWIHFREPIATQRKEAADPAEGERIFVRELERLRISLRMLDPKAHTRIAMTHYPPIGADLQPSRASAILEEFEISTCVFGHLHSLKKDARLFGQTRGVRYLLTSSDYLNFIPLQVL